VIKNLPFAAAQVSQPFGERRLAVARALRREITSGGAAAI